ncbi:ribonucleoside triphosphate reductase [Lacrimispora saccharolytica]|uniref:Anaerobic ribonucleoside-triphosphate reductase n=1 Tax=Lacrimispora saccharolytica (strain ATCC 35040 / DSM 2544 / NRCC 2533 / WM1) TaxID=610130 RepID=D9R6K9_LACSW|nr:ribonucleoside triphosphate reductase [Lacrimispora saccharolytica]ADL05419.1 anaerobic ribonucleoside-triphosphate reductase [[Clostridium] saccharolyticum WM1]QRV20419.1 ribonucleoside triphosphate reductase [Lacrimispora saccharolytica]
MLKVIKRDGAEAGFDLSKVKEAMKKAFTATGKYYTDSIVELLALRVASDFKDKVKEDRVAVEEIQDSVEKVLEETGYTDVAKAYILYRKQRAKIRSLGGTTLDYKDVVDNYVKVEDWHVKENSTVTYSVGGLILNNSGAVTANYWLSEIYDKEIADAYNRGDIHIHDLSMLTGYSCGWSLKRLLLDGLGGITGKITASPAKHLATLCNQMVNFLGIMQNEWAASQSFSSFDTYLAPFVRADGLSYDKVKKCMEAFVFGVNTPSRWGTQAPFSHISLDLTVPKDMKTEKAIVGGRRMDFTYGDCQAEMNMVNRAFLETMMAGDAGGMGFQYPIPVYGLSEDFDWSDTENNRLLFSLASHYGTPYFSNYIKGGPVTGDVRISYEGITPDLTKLRRKAGGYFGYGENTGSIGVVTINLPRIGYLSSDEADFYKRLDQVTDIAARSLKIKRDVIGRLLKNGLYPYTACYLETLENHFSSIGIIGMNEAGLNASWLKAGMDSRRTRDFAADVLNHLKKKLIGYQLEYQSLYCLEATPAESAAYRLAMIDKKEFPDIRTGGKQGDVPYYTNSTKLSSDFEGTLSEALDNQNAVQPLYTAGTVFSVYIEQEEKDWRRVRDSLKMMTENYGFPYMTFTPVYSICHSCGYLSGSQENCPICGKQTDVYSRIAGYYRPVHDWNEGKIQEFKNRKMMSLEV